MKTAEITPHALTRFAQRGMRVGDLDLILWLGTEVHDGYLVRSKDCQVVVRQLKRLIDRVRRLNGRRVVVADNRVITAYRACPRTEHRLLRNAERRALND